MCRVAPEGPGGDRRGIRGGRRAGRGASARALAGTGPRFPRRRAKWRSRRAIRAARSVRPPPYLSRTHVPHADDTPAKQSLAPRAGARGRRYGTRVRDTGRGNPRPRGPAGTGSPAGARTVRAAHRPHLRAPAPAPASSSATCAQERHGPPPRTGVHVAGQPTGGAADLNRTAPRSGRTGAPDGLPTPLGPPQDRAARVLSGAARARLARAGGSERQHRLGRAEGSAAGERAGGAARARASGVESPRRVDTCAAADLERSRLVISDQGANFPPAGARAPRASGRAAGRPERRESREHRVGRDRPPPPAGRTSLARRTSTPQRQRAVNEDEPPEGGS